ncbi:MAG TPA: hypothetical protein VFM49_06335 [Chloroflexia bacterium]|nr:hypothetical protein [Chloroflexia bacterium]
MASNDYHFFTHWRVRGDIAEVYTILAEGANIARWWPAAYREAHPVDLGDGQEGRNAVYMVARGWLPYTLGFGCWNPTPPTTCASKPRANSTARASGGWRRTVRGWT